MNGGQLKGDMPRLEPMDAGLDDDLRMTICNRLNAVLADEFILYTKTRNYHWNVVGPSFYELHKFLDQQYNALNVVVDEIAERIRMLGGRSLGSARGFLAHTRLTDADDRPKAWQDMLRDLQGDHEMVIRGLRAEIDAVERDEGTKDLLIGTMQKHDEMAWMLRSFNARPPTAVDVGGRNLRPTAKNSAKKSSGNHVVRAKRHLPAKNKAT